MSFFNRTTPTPAPVQSSTGSPAISLQTVQQQAPGLVNLYKTAAVSLSKAGVNGQRAAVYLVIDRSPSMNGFYRDGSVQRLAEQALGLSANLDDDGKIPLIFFDFGVLAVVEVELSDYQGVIDRTSSHLRGNGTHYAPAMRTVIDHYQASGATDPAFVIFQTDGQPYDPTETKRLLKEASKLPLFWQFIGFGDPYSGEFDFLKKLDDLRGRAVDNAGFFPAGENPQGMTDEALYDQLMGEFPQWLSAARNAGIL